MSGGERPGGGNWPDSAVNASKEYSHVTVVSQLLHICRRLAKLRRVPEDARRMVLHDWRWHNGQTEKHTQTQAEQHRYSWIDVDFSVNDHWMAFTLGNLIMRHPRPRFKFNLGTVNWTDFDSDYVRSRTAFTPNTAYSARTDLERFRVLNSLELVLYKWTLRT